MTQLRIDHNTFQKGKRAIYSSGWVEGLIDNNTFINCDIAVGLAGDNHFSWNRSIEAGTANSLFIEDNTFLQDNNSDRELNEQIYHQEGARTVVRYNTFDLRSYTTYNGCPFDSHGNQSYYTGNPAIRGQPLLEIYNNNFYIHHTYRVLYIRGGSLLVHDNTVTFETGSGSVFKLSEEESWQTAFFNPLATTWSAEDQIMNSFFWGNTLDGSPITDVSLNFANDATFIQKDRDYFMHAPESSGGKATYDSQEGGAATFSSSGANAYYPYTPYAYLHPLRGSAEPECNDTIDNDGDGQTDYPNDAGCADANDDDETNCNDTVCEGGENCETCPQDCPTGSGEVCCSGILYTGDCCNDSECISPETCNSHVCSEPTPAWVSVTGSASWSACQSATPLSGAAACNLNTANANVQAGDTIYLRSGTYNSYIAPLNSGTATQRIIYQNYNSEIVTIDGAAYAILLDGDDYITVDGIGATGCTRFLYLINGANYNIIKNCSFDDSSDSTWSASKIKASSQYNWIQNCQFSKGGECTAGGSDHGLVLEIGNEESSSDLSNYNLVEDSTLFHGGHHVLGVHGRYNTIRNNYMHNEAWSRDRGNRVYYTTGYEVNTGYNLIENNRFGYAARPCDDYTTGSLSICTKNNIFRYNKLYHHNAAGLQFYGYAGYSDGSYNRIYSNTIFNSGYNIYPTYEEGFEDTAVTFMHSANTGNVIKNNLYFSNYQVYTGYTAAQIFANNWDGDTQGDPLFVNASTTPPVDKNDSTLPNLNLQSGSPAIDVGGALTTVAAADTGSGMSLVVSDAGYFQDGTWAPSGTVDADWIAVGTVGNVVQISSISGNTITLSNSISRQDSDSVWLYKDSDGTIVLYGSAPDAGAYEVLQTSAPVRSGGSPAGILPSGTTSTTLSLSTNENATCRYSTTAGVSYSSMTDTFSTTGGTSHSTTISGLSDGDSYSYCVRCQDDSGNVNTSD
ncbi:MAG: hypothetical protein IMY74_01085, partial [Bacteroidetes bacterium]|nr:hypothetical protein [Bacteroidota bacterium]